MLTVETCLGRAHARCAWPASRTTSTRFRPTFTGTVIGYVSMDALPGAGRAAGVQLPATVFSTEDLTRTKASRLAADLRDKVIEPAGVQVYNMQVPKPGSHFLGDIFKAVSLLLLALGVLSLALSAFLVINTGLGADGAAGRAGRRHEGDRRAHSSQIMAMYLAMVAVYGVLAVLVGLPLGWIAGRWFIAYAAGMLNFRVTSFVSPAYVIAIEIAVGLLRARARRDRARARRLADHASCGRSTRPACPRRPSATGSSTGCSAWCAAFRGRSRSRCATRSCARAACCLTLATLTLASAVVMATLSVRASILQTVDDIGAWWNYDVAGQRSRSP